MTELAKLKWQCRRGMRELDMLLLRYLEQRYNIAPITEQQTFHHLLTLSDAKLYGYFTQYEQPSNSKILALINTILQL